MSNYTPEQRAADAEIALAMGWQRVQLSYLNTEQYAVVPPEWENTTRNQLEFCGAELYRLVPRFHESHDARAALLEWIDGMCKWYAFMEAFAANEEIEWNPGFWNTINKAIALATPAQVAEAALKVIKEGE